MVTSPPNPDLGADSQPNLARIDAGWNTLPVAFREKLQGHLRGHRETLGGHHDELRGQTNVPAGTFGGVIIIS